MGHGKVDIFSLFSIIFRNVCDTASSVSNLFLNILKEILYILTSILALKLLHAVVNHPSLSLVLLDIPALRYTSASSVVSLLLLCKDVFDFHSPLTPDTFVRNLNIVLIFFFSLFNLSFNILILFFPFFSSSFSILFSFFYIFSFVLLMFSLWSLSSFNENILELNPYIINVSFHFSFLYFHDFILV